MTYLGSLVDQGVLVPVHFKNYHSPTNSSARSHCKLSSLVANPVENANQPICQVSGISAADPCCHLRFRVISTPIAQFMQILKISSSHVCSAISQDAPLHVVLSGHLGRVWMTNAFQLTSSIFHCDRICSSTWNDLVFLAVLKPLSGKPALSSIEVRRIETISQWSFVRCKQDLAAHRF